MDMNYLIDFAYRNICFFNFLDISLNNWNIVTKENANEKISIKQTYFREKNDQNLINYQAEEKNCRLYTNECIQIKTDKILEWAKKSKIFLPKELKLEELNNFIDKTLYPTVFNRLVLLKNEKNLILQLLFPQLLNNLLASFELLIDFKKEMLSKLKRENNNSFKSSNSIKWDNKSIDEQKDYRKKHPMDKERLKESKSKFNNSEIYSDEDLYVKGLKKVNQLNTNDEFIFKVKIAFSDKLKYTKRNKSCFSIGTNQVKCEMENFYQITEKEKIFDENLGQEQKLTLQNTLYNKIIV